MVTRSDGWSARLRVDGIRLRAVYRAATERLGSAFYLPVVPDQASSPAVAGSDYLRYD